MIITLANLGFAQELPPDERGLAELLEERLIDTLQYEQLFVYYALPLSVPQGELALLAELFPSLEWIIPAAEELETYQPFDNRQIQKFFDDFPYLVNFRPVLRFNVSPVPRSLNGEVVFGVNKSKIDELEGQRVRFRQKSALLSTDGSIVLTDSGAVFRSRRAAVRAGGVEVEFGNFKYPLEGELFFGNFSALTNEYESARANWLYGATRGWNGVSARARRLGAGGGQFGAAAFYHARPTERGAGAGLDIYVSRGLKVHAAFTAFQSDSINSQPKDSADYHFVRTAHFYAEYKSKVWGAAFETGLPLERESLAMPFSLRLNYHLNGSAAQYHLSVFPSETYAPMSAIRKRTLNEIGVKEYGADVQKHSLKMTVPFINRTKLIPEIDFTESGGTVRRVHASAQFKAGAGNAGFSVKHSSGIFTSESDSVFHISAADVYLRTPYPLGVKAAGERRYGSYRYERTSYSLELPSSALPNMIITPFIRGKYSGSAHEFWLGLRHELYLYKRNWSGITVEIPYGVKGDNNVYVRGSSSFTF